MIGVSVSFSASLKPRDSPQEPLFSVLGEEVTATFFVTHHRAPETTTTRLHRTIKDSDNKDESVLGATTKAFQNRDLLTERENIKMIHRGTTRKNEEEKG